MTDTFTDQIDKTIISQQRMQFTVINHCPKYSTEERQIVKAEIEKKLFGIFCKYV